MSKRIVIDIGNSVVCDYCGDDYTHSTVAGGLLFGSYATCPKCAPKIEADAKKFDEEHFIHARCPDGKSLAMTYLTHHNDR